MTGMQALQMLGEMRPGSLEPVQQVQGWLYAPEAFTMERELSVPAPYAHLYAWYLCAQADLARGEAARYNNSVTVFNDLYEGYTAWHTRTHLPEQKHHVTGIKG